MVKRLSGLQKDVLHLYRECIRVAYTKAPENRPHFIGYIREEFRRHKDLPRKNFVAIEHLLRVGKKKLALYSSPEIKDIR
ncbi:AaceriACR206Cp [[Ashbya] aceris (nom. inval.)]|nr:AaceriACR206Cp [[Ashbya] aceris (nom. inval.)]